MITPTMVRRFAAIALLATGLLSSVAPVHTHAQAASVTPAVRAVLKPLYSPLQWCTVNTQTMLSADRQSVLFNLQDGSPQPGSTNSNGGTNPNDGLAYVAAQTLSNCAAAARAVRNVRLAGRLACNVTVQRVLAQLAAYASANAQGAYYSGKLSFDIADGDASSAQADFNNVTSAQCAADGHLAAAIPYIGKL